MHSVNSRIDRKHFPGWQWLDWRRDEDTIAKASINSISETQARPG
jgi:hypothetical protein